MLITDLWNNVVVYHAFGDCEFNGNLRLIHQETQQEIDFEETQRFPYLFVYRIHYTGHMGDVTLHMVYNSLVGH